MGPELELSVQAGIVRQPILVMVNMNVIWEIEFAEKNLLLILTKIKVKQ